MSTEKMCAAEHTIKFTYAELTLECDMQAGHTTPRHRQHLNPQVTIFWDN